MAIEIQPTGEVSEYTATLTGETLREGKDGRHKVDSLKLSLKAEGREMELSTLAFQYNSTVNSMQVSASTGIWKYIDRGNLGIIYIEIS